MSVHGEENENEAKQPLNNHLKSFLYRAVVIVGSGGLIFGYDIGVISGTLPSISDDFDLDGYEEGLVVSILYAGSILGSLFGGPLCDSIGRWKTIQIQNLVFVFGALLTGLAPNLGTLCAGRFFVGIASAISGLADVPYLTEIAPSEYRGLLSGQYEILVGAGILLSFCLDLAFSSFPNGWRWAFVLPGIFAFIQSILLFLLPESPKWLIAKGRLDEARLVLQHIYGEEASSKYLNEFIQSSSEKSVMNKAELTITSAMQYEHPSYQSSPSATTTHSPLTTSTTTTSPIHATVDKIIITEKGESTEPSEKRILTSTSSSNQSEQEKLVLKEYQYAIIVIIMIQILSQITGANVIRNYAPTIFENGGVSEGLALFYNVILGIVKLIFTILSVYYIESTGRRKFFLFGIFWVITGMTFLMIASIFTPSGTLNNPEVFVIGCAFVYAGFGFGYGPMPWVLSSEMVPTIIRGRVLCLSLVASNLTQLIMNFLFIPMSEYLLGAGTFATFLILNILTFYYIYHFIVETKEISSEKILKGLFEKYAQLRNISWKEFICMCFARRDAFYTEVCLEPS